MNIIDNYKTNFTKNNMKICKKKNLKSTKRIYYRIIITVFIYFQYLCNKIKLKDESCVIKNKTFH